MMKTERERHVPQRLSFFHWLMLAPPVLLLLSGVAVGATKDEPKMVSGMSIVGNNEAPKSLYIVPWKSSETGADNGLSSSLLNEQPVPVDKDVFMRELNFYELSNAK